MNIPNCGVGLRTWLRAAQTTGPGLIAHILAAPAGEDQLALRDGAAYFARLSRRPAQPATAPLELRRDATYLVTGGLGAVGLELAEYLAAHGAGHLVLTGRRPPSEAARRRIEAVREQYGCEVVVLAADVADPDDVARVLTTIRTELPRLVGIVHAAGELGTCSLLDMDDAEVDRVFAGKVWGAWYLSEAAASLQLDFFVCTSSIAAVWGTRTQIVYSAANAFLDGLAWRLRERGVPGVSVQFGLWSAGMGDRDDAGTTGRAWDRDVVVDRRAGRDGRARHRIGTTRNGGPDRLVPLRAVPTDPAQAVVAGEHRARAARDRGDVDARRRRHR